VRKYRTQEPPFAVSIELAEGCNLYCDFCALPGIRTRKEKNYKFMTEDTLVSLCTQMRDLGWKARVGYQLHGEGTMHPDYVGMVRATHQLLPRSNKSMLSNGGGLLRKPGAVANVRALFEAGLNVLSLDDYEGAGIVPKIIEQLNEHAPLVSGKEHPLGFMFYRYPEDLRGNPHARRKRGSATLVQVRDIAAQAKDKHRGNHTVLYNYAGVGAPPDASMAGARCAQPFRQLAVRWNGDVAICCNDWRGAYYCGNVVTDGVQAVWQGAAMGAAREKLIRGERDFAPCVGCNHRSYRVGLLPDLKGRGKLHRPDAQTERDITLALRRGPLTQVVKREWEK
jgi:hypothetical protein